MSGFKGTPGPWDGKDVGICKQDDAGLQLGFISTSCEQRRSECAANAMLIAAAPELLEALQVMVAARPASCNTVEISLARAAIAKALGQ